MTLMQARALKSDLARALGVLLLLLGLLLVALAVWAAERAGSEPWRQG